MKNQDKQEISLLTLLANEATSDARKLLRKYEKQDAVSYSDLEKKLAELYFNTPDRKLEIEKDFARIHPHKKWLLRNTELPKSVEVKKEEVKTEEVKPKEVAHCNCPACEKARVMADMKFSSAEGDRVMQQPQAIQVKDNTGLVVIGAVAIAAIITFAILNKK